MMTSYHVAWNAATKVATVQFKGDALTAGSTNIGNYDHDAADSDVHYHHVRDLLYNQGEQNMQEVQIDIDDVYVAVTGLAIAPTTVTKAPAATQQLTPTFTPSSPSNTAITYTSSNPAKATVSPTGLITAVATGSATITATSQDGGFTATCVVTVS